MPEVLVIAGSKSDEKIVSKTVTTLEEYGISYSIEYASAHREPERVRSIVDETDAKVIIAIAGLSAALPGFVASLTDKPVIGVPVSAALGGLDALLSIVQMPKGVPVATVGIDNGQNAAHLAARILRANTSNKTIPKTYAEAGVDETAVSRGLKMLREYIQKSHQGFEISHEFGHYANAVQVADDIYVALTTDGVGSKVMVAELARKFDTIGEDCVAMNVNDLICIGATPVGFVDYLACKRSLPEKILAQIGEGILNGCKKAGVPILGGETAILPEIIQGGSEFGFDLAGAAVGIARANELVVGVEINPGDSIIGVSSNGLHSNGFTLARKVILSRHSLDEKLPWGVTVAEEMLRPTKIYVPHFKRLRQEGIDIKGIAHITGQAFKKLLRLGNYHFRITDFPKVASIFTLIKDEAQITWEEMFTTFNMGIGFVVIVSPEQEKKALAVLQKLDAAQKIGTIEKSNVGTVTIEQFEVEIK